MSNYDDLQAPPADFADAQFQQDIVEWGDQIAGIVRAMGIKTYPATEQKPEYRSFVYSVEITDYIPNDHVGEEHRLQHNYAKKDDEQGNPIFARFSQGALNQYILNTELKITKPQDLYGKHVLFERRGISSLPGYKKNPELTAENERLYPVKVLK